VGAWSLRILDEPRCGGHRLNNLPGTIEQSSAGRIICVVRCDAHADYSRMLKPDVVDSVKVLLNGLSIDACQVLVRIYLP
jgi:hypothetical protein